MDRNNLTPQDAKIQKSISSNNIDDEKLEDMLKDVRSFDDQPITPHDKKILKDWLKKYYRDKNDA